MTIHKFEYLGIPDEVIQDNTKKLNARIAISVLSEMDDEGLLSDDQLNKCMSLSERLSRTALYKNDGEEQLEAGIEQAFFLIEEYLIEQGV